MRSTRYHATLLVAVFSIVPAPLVAQDVSSQSLAKIQQQIDAQEAILVELKARKIVIAKKALEDEAKAIVQGNEARKFLASVGETTPPPTTDAKSLNDIAVANAQKGLSTSTTTNTDGSTTTKVAPTDPKSLGSSPKNIAKFGGWEYGIGLSYTRDLGRNRRILDAENINGIVRVKHAQDSRARLILETHYLFTPEGGFLGLENVLEKRPKDQTPFYLRNEWGVGPFVALQPGSDNIIDAIGAGVMLALRRPGTDSQSFNIGIGVMYDINAKILGDGLVENQPLPAGEETIRLKTIEQSGLLLMTSYSF